MRVLALRDRGVRIAAVGSYLPERVVRNEDLVALGVPMDPSEIERLTGIQERRWASPEEATSDLATRACARALASAAAPPGTIDRLFVATVSPDHMSPSTACFVQRNLGLGQAPACDLGAACSGFLYGLDAGARAVLTGDLRVLVCAADVRSRFLDLSDRATAALFGDGAGAALLEPCKAGEGILAIGLAADGAGVHSVHVPAGGSRRIASPETVAERAHVIRMAEGPQVYLAAIEGMAEAGGRLLAALGMGWADVDLVVPHQPNRRILDRLARVVRLPEGKLFVNVERTGNVSGATCAIALAEALASGRTGAGDKVLLLAAGAGYTAGAALLVVDEALIASSRGTSLAG